MQEIFRRKKLFAADHAVYYKKDGGKHDFTVVQEYLYNADRVEIGKVSAMSVRISWDSLQDDLVQCYYVMSCRGKNSRAAGKWKIISRIESDGKAGDAAHLYTNHLDISAPQQYEYKICILSMDQTIDTSSRSYDAETDKYDALKLDRKNIVIRWYIIRYNWYIRREKIMRKPEA